MMIRILDKGLNTLDDILSELKENPSVSLITVEELKRTISQITDIHNELCRLEENL